MTEHEHKHHDHSHDHHGHSQAPPPRSWWKQLHRDWRAWVAVLLMLVAILAYVMTMDESFRPGRGIQQPVPAAP